MGNLFDALIVYPLLNVLIALYQAFNSLGIPYSFAFSIIAVSALIRLVLFPISGKQIRHAAKQQELSPYLSKIRDQHKGDNKRMMQETSKLYKEHGFNQFGGCLPIIVQIIFSLGFFSVLNKALHLSSTQLVDYINGAVYFKLLEVTSAPSFSLFGIDIGKSPSQLMGAVVVVAVAIPVITGILQLIQSKMLMPRPVGEYKGDTIKEKKEKEKAKDTATQIQGQMLFLVPLLIAGTSFTFPLGLSLYWNTFTIFGIIQQYKIQGWGGMDTWIKKYGRKS